MRVIAPIHKYAPLQGGMVCGWRPMPRGWRGRYDTFWDRVTCRHCLKRKVVRGEEVMNEGVCRDESQWCQHNELKNDCPDCLRAEVSRPKEQSNAHRDAQIKAEASLADKEKELVVLKREPKHMGLADLVETIAAQAQEIKTLESRLIPPLYHEGHECCRKCVMENAALKQAIKRLEALEDLDHEE